MTGETDSTSSPTDPSDFRRTSTGSTPLLRVKGLTVSFRVKERDIVAVEDVSFELPTGAVISIVGESGSGKSVMARTIVGLLPKNARQTGSIQLDGSELTGLEERDWRRIRGAEIGLVLQDPLRALDPTMTIGKQIAEAIRLHRSLSKAAVKRAVVELLRDVRITNGERRFGAYPHELSGGMRQRVAIAMALACEPRLLIADEATTALDASTQAEIIELLRLIQSERNMSMLFVSHDLPLAADIADEVLVMYGGRAMEQLPAEDLDDCVVPYTRALMGASPAVALTTGAFRQPLEVIPGHALTRRGRVEGCVFAPRCASRTDVCGSKTPPVVTDDSGRHAIRCWNPMSAGDAADQYVEVGANP